MFQHVYLDKNIIIINSAHGNFKSLDQLIQNKLQESFCLPLCAVGPKINKFSMC